MAETQTDAATLERLLEISSLLNSTLKLDDLLGQIMASATELTSAETSSLLLLDEEAGELTVEVATGAPGEAIAREHVPAGEGIAGWVVEHGEAANVSDPKSDPRFYGGIDEKTGFETKSILAVPMKTRERTIGVIEVINKRDGSFDERDQRLAEALANHAAIAVDNARLYARLADAVVTSRMSYRTFGDAVA
jgi:GAF domain-containing protein